MRINTRGMYQGQAIAIVMVILVVGAILGASLYSRTLKNNEDVINKADSDVSLEQADTVIDLITSTIDFSKLNDISKLEGGENTFSSFSDLLLAANGSASGDFSDIDNWCKNSTDPNEASPSYLNITIDRTLASENIDITTGDARTFDFSNAVPNAPSPTLSLFVNPVGTDYAIIAIKRIYKDRSTFDYKEYSEADIQSYCIYSSSSDSVCTDPNISGVDPSSSLTIVHAGDPITVPLDSIGSYNIENVRVIPLKTDVTLSYALVGMNISDRDLAYVRINVAVNCYGSYREKQVVFPSAESLGYSTIFDYSIYNNGTLTPN